MTEVPVWMLMFYTLSAVVTVVFIFWQSRKIRNITRLASALSRHLHECTGVVEAMSARGNVICDICHQPIAPKTPTLIEEQEQGWTITHDICP